MSLSSSVIRTVNLTNNKQKKNHILQLAICIVFFTIRFHINSTISRQCFTFYDNKSLHKKIYTQIAWFLTIKLILLCVFIKVFTPLYTSSLEAGILYWTTHWTVNPEVPGSSLGGYATAVYRCVLWLGNSLQPRPSDGMITGWSGVSESFLWTR